MSEDEYIEGIHRLIQVAVQRAGGNWKRSFKDETMQIMDFIAQAYKEGLEDSGLGGKDHE